MGEWNWRDTVMRGHGDGERGKRFELLVVIQNGTLIPSPPPTFFLLPRSHFRVFSRPLAGNPLPRTRTRTRTSTTPFTLTDDRQAVGEALRLDTCPTLFHRGINPLLHPSRVFERAPWSRRLCPTEGSSSPSLRLCVSTLFRSSTNSLEARRETLFQRSSCRSSRKSHHPVLHPPGHTKCIR